ncbi:Uncharacterised protein [Mycobacterium xenopi]|uniref:Uncharacterized protein n=1 Tax=Mycobacterium xenopi TaxID=1789 RepID=A0AAD1GX82_MYCXE|nr:hypothetical protein MYXE_08080 [Mycobacterium xenopi]SPX79078.1 Uncharacterised protein [Mycobacterium xenopi]
MNTVQRMQLEGWRTHVTSWHTDVGSSAIDAREFVGIYSEPLNIDCRTRNLTLAIC